LDALRGLAILLVVGHHTNRDWLLGRFFHNIGWAGVDLFFVLSGYLVAGLLVKEWQSRGNADVGRFLVRRAFKIYPSFWVMLAVTAALLHLLGKSIPLKALICELLFIQNYGPSIWASTWSLAVEEHFYLGFALLFVWFNQRGKLPRTSRALQAAAALLLVVILVRVASHQLIPPRFKFLITGTHVRGDALACGALIALIRNQSPQALAAWMGRRRQILTVVTVVFAVSVYTFANDPRVLSTVGYTMTYLAAAGALLLVLHTPSRPLIPGVEQGFRCLAFVGRSSYGIYLWNLPVKTFLMPWLVERNLIAPDRVDAPGPLFLFSIVVGISLSWLIEQPALRLRDRWFPARAVASPRDFSILQADPPQSGALVRA
jgi:peptidoglycan/LPS O-acetylase OafA/YrhL